MTTIYDDLGSIDTSQIHQFEESIHFHLPDDYRHFLQAHNGGRPRPVYFKYHDPLRGEKLGSINKFFGISDEEDRHSIVRNIKHFQSYVQAGLLPIADEGGGNYIFLTLSGENIGKVFYWNHNIDPSEGNLFFIANSFSDLFNNLFEYKEEEDEEQ